MNVVLVPSAPFSFDLCAWCRFDRFKSVHGDDHPLVANSTENIRALTTKIVKAAQHNQQTSILAAAKSASSASGGAGRQTLPEKGKVSVSGKPALNNGGAAEGASNKSASKGSRAADPAVKPVATGDGGTGGVEESKVNGPQQVGSAGGNGKSSKKKNKSGR